MFVPRSVAVIGPSATINRVPEKSVPMKLPWTTLPVASGPVISTPAVLFPEMMFRPPDGDLTWSTGWPTTLPPKLLM